MLPVFHSTASPPTIYVTAEDRCLRESFSSNAPSLPAFHDVTERSGTMERLNVFLVILNAEIKFSRYLHTINQNPPQMPLPPDVLNLMHLTVELVDLLYWHPVPTQGSPGYPVFAERMERLQYNILPSVISTKKKWIPHLSADTDLETRKEHGRALMSGHGVQLCATLPFISMNLIH